MSRILAALIPERFTSPSSRRLAAAAILLFPPALVCGFLLLLRAAAPLPVPVTVNREKALSLAREFLIREGVPGLRPGGSCIGASDESLLSYANTRPDRSQIWKIDPPIAATCSIKVAGSDSPAVVILSVDGSVVGFNRKEIPPPGPELSDRAALSLATSRLPPGLHFGSPSIDTDSAGRTYTFRSSSLRDADLKVSVTVHANRVTAYRSTVEPDDSSSSHAGAMQTVLTVCGSLFVCAVVLFGIYRYVSRTLQQEVSHQRSMVVAFLCGGFCVAVSFNAVVQSDAMSVPFVFILLGFAVAGVIGGTLVAIVYGSGEGDVREAYPGKLTSLDTLLTGRFSSRNIGVSVISGTACAGWLAFLMGAAESLIRTGEPLATQAMLAPFVRLWWLMPLVTLPLLSLCFAAAGLLQPLAFLNRFGAKAVRWHLPVLVVCAGLVSTLRTHTRSNEEFLLSSAIFVLALLLPFFLFDLFASLICVAVVFSVGEMASNLAAVPAFCGPYILVHSLIGLGVLIFSVASVARGRLWSEEEVRPLYARHIAERKSLEAEVSAAREAQLRLLPECVPDFAGLNISAACVPAETVGGDFYDFFPLSDGRLGVFIAEGNKGGLAAALTIALAKGYLMQCVERFHEPVEILSRLESALASMFESESVFTDFAFAAIDTMAGEIRYARTGSYPRVVVISTGSAGRPAAPGERMVLVKGRNCPLNEGRASLTPGDHVVLFTEGIGRRLALSNRKPEEVTATLVLNSAGNTADEIRAKLFGTAKTSLDPDDLTVIVIRMHALAEQPAAWGVVA